MIQYRNTQYHCPMELTLALIGGKWKALILWHLGENTLRSGELKRLLPEITPKMMSQQLKELESNGFVNRIVYPQVPPKVEYTLTDSGRKILPVLKVMYQWGLDYIDETDDIVEC